MQQSPFQSETRESSAVSDWAMFIVFCVAGAVFASSVLVQLGTITGMAAALFVGIAVWRFMPEARQ